VSSPVLQPCEGWGEGQEGKGVGALPLSLHGLMLCIREQSSQAGRLRGLSLCVAFQHRRGAPRHRSPRSTRPCACHTSRERRSPRPQAGWPRIMPASLTQAPLEVTRSFDEICNCGSARCMKADDRRIAVHGLWVPWALSVEPCPPLCGARANNRHG
jgi:hypothetical protein